MEINCVRINIPNRIKRDVGAIGSLINTIRATSRIGGTTALLVPSRRIKGGRHVAPAGEGIAGP